MRRFTTTVFFLEGWGRRWHHLRQATNCLRGAPDKLATKTERGPSRRVHPPANLLKSKGRWLSVPTYCKEATEGGMSPRPTGSG